MRNETFQRILDRTSPETKSKVAEHVDSVLSGVMRMDDVLSWIKREAYRGDRRFNDYYRNALAACVEKFCTPREMDGQWFVPVWQIERHLIKSEMRRLQTDIVTHLFI